LTDTDKQSNTGKYTNTTQKSKQRKIEQNFLGWVALYNTRPGNEVGLFYNARELINGVISNFPVYYRVIRWCADLQRWLSLLFCWSSLVVLLLTIWSQLISTTLHWLRWLMTYMFERHEIW